MNRKFNSVTSEVLAQVAKDKNIPLEKMPTGGLITNGERFDEFAESVAEGKALGIIDPDSRPVGVVDRSLVSYDKESGGVEVLDFIGVIGGGNGSLGFMTQKGISWYTKEQAQSLAKALALL